MDERAGEGGKTAAERAIFESLPRGNRELRVRITALEALVDSLQRRQREVRLELGESRSAATRQAALFRRRRVRNPS